MPLKINKEWFIDEHKRSVLLRGVNLGGSSKVPFEPNGVTHIKTDFSNHRDVSFVGRPFPLKEADEHYYRLKRWGFNCLRFLITWEAIEHKGPKQYDKEYLDYIEEVLKIAEKYKFYVFIDPHQDVWSRMSGGDGAPGWTFEKVGLDFKKFDDTDAALVMQYRYDPNDPKAYPEMTWGSNKFRFADGTMWTLFFGGKNFAPSFKIDGINAQDYLQNHYIESIKQVALRIKDLSYVVGFDSLNEPEQGWIEKFVDGTGKERVDELGLAFSPIDAMLTGSGFTRTVGFKEVKGIGIKETRKDVVNKGKISCWLDGKEDIWRKEGIWDLDKNRVPIILKNDHFVKRNDTKVDFYLEHLSPFINRYAKDIRSVIPDTIIFFEGPADRPIRGEQNLNFDIPKNVVHAAHWYDVASLGTKKAWIRGTFDVMRMKMVIGTKKVQKTFTNQLKSVKNYAKGSFPTLIGEFGMPFDIDKKKPFDNFKKIGEKAFSKHIKLLNMYYNALDTNLLHSTQWNYTADNDNKWGDQWNLEDLSIFSKNQQITPKDVNSGGRGIEGFCRPHIICCSGLPLKMEFEIKDGRFYFEFDGNPKIDAPTIIYVPKIHYPNGYDVGISEGTVEKSEEEQLLILKIIEQGIHKVEIFKKRKNFYK